MLRFLHADLPKEIVELIALFEGRVLVAYLRDYVSQVYSRVYKQYFGYKFSLKYITGGYRIHSNRWTNVIIEDVGYGHLPYYCAWSTMIRKKHPEFVRSRRHRGHMRNLWGTVSDKRLLRERERIEKELAPYFKYVAEELFSYRPVPLLTVIQALTDDA